MFSIKQAKRYCCDDISLIENYHEALNSGKKYEIHHRKETDENLTFRELKEMGLYYKRPADELIFLDEFTHKSLHQKGLSHYFTQEHRDNIGKSKSGVNNPNYGKRKSEDFKLKVGKKVLQIDPITNSVIKEWDYMAKAARTLGIRRNQISDVCAGRGKTAGGFGWRFAS